MVRLARYDIPGIPRHVVQRGNNRGVTFAADEDYAFYLECPEDASARWGCADSYFLACCRYIEMNPVRAGMVAAPGDYPWSSWHAHATGADAPLLSDHPHYTALGASPAERQAAYRALVAVALEEPVTTAIRDATNKAWVLGGGRFKDELAALTGRRLVPTKPGRPRKTEKPA